MDYEPASYVSPNLNGNSWVHSIGRNSRVYERYQIWSDARTLGLDEYAQKYGETYTNINAYWRYYQEEQIANGVQVKRPQLIISGRLNGGYQLNGRMTDFSNSNMVLTVGGAIYGAMEGATAGDGYWLGKNGKYYTNMAGRGPNQYTGSRTAALNSAKTYRLAGRATIFVSAGVGVYSTIEGIQADGGEFGYNAQIAAFGSAGSITGGIAGAKGGALIGAGIGAWFGGVGAIPGAVIGGFIGGIAGSIGGGYDGESAVNYYHGRYP
ncbi:MAG: hypothetical protein AAF600_17375 [Bacteroidota bacterium]